MESANRKLIRPSLTEIKEQISPPRRAQKKPSPPDQTNAENFYYVKQMQAKTPMVFVLRDGETLLCDAEGLFVTLKPGQQVTVNVTHSDGTKAAASVTLTELQ